MGPHHTRSVTPIISVSRPCTAADVNLGCQTTGCTGSVRQAHRLLRPSILPHHIPPAWAQSSPRPQTIGVLVDLEYTLGCAIQPISTASKQHARCRRLDDTAAHARVIFAGLSARSRGGPLLGCAYRCRQAGGDIENHELSRTMSSPRWMCELPRGGRPLCTLPMRLSACRQGVP